MSSDKMNTSDVYILFEELKALLKQNNGKPVAMPSAQVDVTAINSMAERFENLVEEVRKPVKMVRHHIIDVGSSKVFFSLIAMGIVLLVFAFVIRTQRQTISQYRDNDLKYRYIKMQGQTSEENIYRLDRQFEYRDSIAIIRKQVEEYERLVKKQVGKMEQVRLNAVEAERLQKKAESLKVR